MEKKYKCLLIGLGKRSIDDHIPALIPNVLGIKFVGVCDTNPTKEKTLKEIIKGKDCNPSFYTNLSEACEKENPDFAIIATPHCTHLKIAKELLKRKIAFLKEKPFAINLKEGIQLKNLIKKHNGYIKVCAQRRHHPLYIYGKKALTHLQNIRRFDAQYQLHVNGYYTGWRSTPKDSGGGCVIDMGYHYLDLLYWYFGMPEQIFAITAPKYNKNMSYTIEETAQISLKYSDGKIGNLFLSLCEPSKVEELHIYGKHGHINLRREFLKRFDEENNLIECLSREPAWPSAVSDVLIDFLENFKNPEFVKKECENGLAVTKMTHAIYQSIETKKPILLKKIKL